MNESSPKGPGLKALDRIREAITPEVNDIRIVVKFRATKGFELENGGSLLGKLPDKVLTPDDARKFLGIEDHDNLLRFGQKFDIPDEQALVAMFMEFNGYGVYLSAILDKAVVNGFDKDKLRSALNEHLVSQQSQ